MSKNDIKANDAIEKLRYDFIYPNEGAAEMRPEYKDGRLWLRFAPRPSPQRNAAVSISAGETKRLPTGTKLYVPDGYGAHVCQVETRNGSERLIVGDILVGDTQEVEVTYRSAEHMYVHPKKIIGCVLLVPLAKYTVEASSAAGKEQP